MSNCAVCNRSLSEDPNEAENVIECRYCDALVCSEECANDHEEQSHPDEALPTPPDRDDRP
jgi:hypothetical protein